MAEQEIVKHGRKIYKVWKDPGSWKHRATELFIEILVIVFAITLSLLLERWREDQHDRHLEKEFLTDLKDDISIKLKELKTDSINLAKTVYESNYLCKTGLEQIPFNKDSADVYARHVISSFYFINSNNAIFESLKHSGKIAVITSKALRVNIIKLYQEDMPVLQTILFQFYFPVIEQMKLFVIKNKIEKEGTSNLLKLLMTDSEFVNLFEEVLIAYKNVLSGYSAIMRTNYQILMQIEHELK